MNTKSKARKAPSRAGRTSHKIHAAGRWASLQRPQRAGIRRTQRDPEAV